MKYIMVWICAGVWPVWATMPAPATAETSVRRWACEVVYLPERSRWRREVSLSFDAQRLRTVHIDAQPVYSFQVHGTRIATALDNERIELDTEALSWQSDFRRYASGQGRCTALD